MAGFKFSDPLSRILAKGGEQSLALAFFQGYGAERVSNLVARRFSNLGKRELRTLEAFASAMVEAGTLFNSLAASDRLPEDRLPINPFLSQEDETRGRVRWVGEVTFEGAEHGTLVYGYSPDIPTADELRQDIISGGMDIAEMYPGKFGLNPDQELVVSGVRIISVEGSY